MNGKLLSAAARPAKSDRRVSCLCEHSRDAGVLVQCQVRCKAEIDVHH